MGSESAIGTQVRTSAILGARVRVAVAEGSVDLSIADNCARIRFPASARRTRERRSPSRLPSSAKVALSTVLSAAEYSRLLFSLYVCPVYPQPRRLRATLCEIESEYSGSAVAGPVVSAGVLSPDVNVHADEGTGSNAVLGILVGMGFSCNVVLGVLFSAHFCEGWVLAVDEDIISIRSDTTATASPVARASILDVPTT